MTTEQIITETIDKYENYKISGGFRIWYSHDFWSSQPNFEEKSSG